MRKGCKATIREAIENGCSGSHANKIISFMYICKIRGGIFFTNVLSWNLLHTRVIESKRPLGSVAGPRGMDFMPIFDDQFRVWRLKKPGSTNS